MRLSYETAQRLKDAGFPQDGDGYTMEHPDCKGWGGPHPDCTEAKRPYCPTLEELIEACGKRFLDLKRDWHVMDDEVVVYWVAIGEVMEHEWLSQKGSTHTEAVAALWLALNQKSV